jgi:hypothetical protein
VATEIPASVVDPPHSSSTDRATLWVWIARALDVAIAFYALALLIIVVWGGIDFGWLTINQAAKPILVLWFLVPVRLAMRSAPLEIRFRQSWRHEGLRLQAIAARIPPSVRDVAFAFLVTRLTVTAIGFLFNLLYPSARTRPFDLPFESAKLAETFAAWDSGWYFDIAKRGYYYSADGQSSIAFSPLYPLAMRALAWPFGSSDAALWGAGIAISFAAFLAGLIVLHRLTHRMCGDREVARRTVLYLSVFPFSFFLTRVYPSGLFFLLSVAAIGLAHGSRWWLAGLLGGLAALTRPQGILVAVPLLLMALQGARGKELVSRVVALSPVPLAFLGYHVYIGMLAGHALAWLETERQWGFTMGHPPWQLLLRLIATIERVGLYDYFFTSSAAAYHLFHGVAALFFLAMTPAVFKRLGLPLGAYVLVSLIVPLSGNALEGIGRYSAVIFPVFIALALIKSPRVHEALLIVWSLFLALFVGLFVTWRPIY